MGAGSILTIISAVLSITAEVIGNYYLAKWITAARVWWRQYASAALKIEAEAQFAKVQSDWDNFQQDRPDKEKP